MVSLFVEYCLIVDIELLLLCGESFGYLFVGIE